MSARFMERRIEWTVPQPRASTTDDGQPVSLGAVAGILGAQLVTKILPNQVTGCWEWIGARDGRGYGNVKVAGRVRKAHRVVYERLRGPIGAEVECDHACRVPWCVNPGHIELVSHVENVRRGAARWVAGARQRAKRRCPRGHRYTEANTYVQPSNGGRACRTCARERKRRVCIGPEPHVALRAV